MVSNNNNNLPGNGSPKSPNRANSFDSEIPLNDGGTKGLKCDDFDRDATFLNALLFFGEKRQEPIDALQKWLGLKADPNFFFQENGSPLVLAAAKGYAACVRSLLNSKADPNLLPPGDWFTPLQAASFAGELKTVEALLEGEACPDLADAKGVTPLMVAAATGNVGCIEALLKKGADPDLQMPGGVSALYVAVQNNHKDCVKTLLAHNAKPNLACDNGSTPLIVAAERGFRECTQMLLEQNADPNQATLAGATPLELAAQNGHADCVQVLLEDVRRVLDLRGLGGGTALYFSVQNNHDDCVKTLLAYKANPNLALDDGVTPLMKAAEIGNWECVWALLERKADPNQATQ